jgi:predicted DNA-binding protein YlxM (UPF0122 family)
MREIRTSGIIVELKRLQDILREYEEKLEDVDKQDVDDIDYYEVRDIRTLIEELTEKIEDSEIYERE